MKQEYRDTRRQKRQKSQDETQRQAELKIAGGTRAALRGNRAKATSKFQLERRKIRINTAEN